VPNNTDFVICKKNSMVDGEDVVLWRRDGRKVGVAERGSII
jgi:hypothetical protein